jgi:hypothetical protein
LVVFTGGLVVVGAGQGFLIFQTLKATSTAADAAKEAAEAAVAVELPRLFISATNMHFDVEIADGKTIVCDYRIQNYGRTPALLESYDVNLRCYSVLPAVPDYKMAWPARRILYPREEMGEGGDLRVRLLSIDRDGMPTLGAGTELYLFGCFHYRDVFGASVVTGFCYRSEALNGYLVRSGGEAYNYDHRKTEE